MIVTKYLCEKDIILYAVLRTITEEDGEALDIFH